jgi:purine-binding chemotaxis protein CheW
MSGILERGRGHEDDGHGERWQTLARRAAAARAGSAEPTMLLELLVCDLAGSPYAIPVDRVREIVRVRPMTAVPRTPDWLLGVISLRGAVVQVVDLRMCLGLETTGTGRRTRIVVLHAEDDEISGILVDGVRSVLRVDPESIQPSSHCDARAVGEICREGDEFISIVDLDRVLEGHADA